MIDYLCDNRTVIHSCYKKCSYTMDDVFKAVGIVGVLSQQIFSFYWFFFLCVCVCLFFTLVLLFKKLCVARKRIPDWQPYWSSALLGPLLLSLVLRRQRLWESRAEHELVQGINLQSVQ